MFLLAPHLGRTVEELQATLTTRELMNWIAFYELDPWGERRADLRAGIVASTTYNMQRGKSKALKASDFMPDFEPQKPQTVQEMQTIFLTSTGAKIDG